MDLIDLVPRFEDKSHADHTYNAIAALQRLEDEGRLIFSQNAGQLKRWERGCKTLSQRLNAIGGSSSQYLASDLRDFIHDFEHDSERLHQMLKGVDDDDFVGMSRGEIMAWFSLVYQLSTYGILASHIPDHRSRLSVSVETDTDSGETKEKWSLVAHIVPKRFKSFRRRIR